MTLDNWFKSFSKDRKQYTTIQEITSDQNSIDYDVPQGSVLGLLLFLVVINDFHCTIQFSVVYYFADDTILLLSNYSLKKLNKHLLIGTWILQMNGFVQLTLH